MKDIFQKLITFLSDLDRGKISYTLNHNRDETIMVTLVVPGERWEVEFFANGSVEVERFISNGEIYNESVFDELFSRYKEL